jgi:hypothetical protein
MEAGKKKVCLLPYIFTPDNCPDGTEYCIANKVCGKARYSASGTCKKGWHQSFSNKYAKILVIAEETFGC